MEPYQPAPRAELIIFRIWPSATETSRSLTCRPRTSSWIADPFQQASAHIPQEPYADDGGNAGASTAGPRTELPKHEDVVVATPPPQGYIHRSIIGAHRTDERELDLG